MSHDLQKQNRKQNKNKKQKTKRCAINGRLFPLKWCFSRWPLTAAIPSFILFLVWFGGSSVDDWAARLIHKFQATAFSSISIVIYKVRAHHFSPCSLLKAAALLDTAPVCSIFKPTHLSPRGQQRSLRSRDGCRPSAPPEVSTRFCCYDTCSTGRICTSPIWRCREEVQRGANTRTTRKRLKTNTTERFTWT